MMNSVSESNTSITTITGKQQIGKSNTDVKVFWVPGSSSLTSYLPKGVCSSFPNIIEFLIGSRKLKEVSRDIFTGCSLTTKLIIVNSLITSVNPDTFEELTALTILKFYDNANMGYLPSDLFAKNTKLKELDCSGNNLKFINSKLPTTLTKANFKGNSCINKSFPGDIAALSTIVNEIEQNCKFVMIEVEIAKLRNKITSLENANREKYLISESMRTEQLKYLVLSGQQAILVKNLTNDLSECNTKSLMFTQLQQNYSSVIIENQEKSKEIEVLKANTTVSKETMDGVFQEIIGLRLNVSNMNERLIHKTQKYEMCMTENTYLNNSLIALNSNLSTTIIESDNLRTKMAELELNLTKTHEEFITTFKIVNEELTETETNLTISLEREEEMNKNLTNLKDSEAYTLSLIDDQKLYITILIILIIIVSIGWLLTAILHIKNKHTWKDFQVDMQTLIRD